MRNASLLSVAILLSTGVPTVAFANQPVVRVVSTKWFQTHTDFHGHGLGAGKLVLAGDRSARAEAGQRIVNHLASMGYEVRIRNNPLTRRTVINVPQVDDRDFGRPAMSAINAVNASAVNAARNK